MATSGRFIEIDGARQNNLKDVSVRIPIGAVTAVTGVAGPEGGSEEKPVGTVWFSVARRDGLRIDRKAHLPGGRPDVRDRATTVTLHLLRRVLLGLGDLDV